MKEYLFFVGKQKEIAKKVKEGKNTISTSPRNVRPPESTKFIEGEISARTLQNKYDSISHDYEEQFLNVGFPPKIC